MGEVEILGWDLYTPDGEAHWHVMIEPPERVAVEVRACEGYTPDGSTHWVRIVKCECEDCSKGRAVPDFPWPDTQEGQP